MNGHVLVIVIAALFNGINCANILFLSGVPSQSHHLYNRVLAVGLTEKGHNVTFVSADLSNKTTPNLHYIHLENVYATQEAVYLIESTDINMLDYLSQSQTEYLLTFTSYCEVICGGILSSHGLDFLLNYPTDFKFDAVIDDFTFGPCLLPLIHRFNYPPLIKVTAFINPPYTTDLVGGQKYPSYVPHYTADYPAEMTFMQRYFNYYLYFTDWA